MLSRRRFLAGAAALAMASGRVVRAQPAGTKRLKVIVTGGHPGDPEYGCGGTVARYVERGDQVTLLYLNHGEKGCAGKSASACGELRTAEAQKACQILGASAKFSDQIDGEASVNAASYDRLLALMRVEAPDVVFTQWPIDNHRDHRAISNLVYDVWLRAKKSFGLYFYEVSDGEDTLMFAPTDYVDIAKVETKKRAACFAHASQTPERYYALQSEVSHFRAVESGCQEAEAFIRHSESVGHWLP